MKTVTLIQTIAVAFSLPMMAMAQDPKSPGKASDSVKEPAPTNPERPAQPLRTPNSSEREPGKASDSVKEPSPTASQKKMSGEIIAVSKADKTITISDSSKGSHKIHIGETTMIKRGGKSASWDDLKVGAKVDASCRGSDKMHAESVEIGS